MILLLHYADVHFNRGGHDCVGFEGRINVNIAAEPVTDLLVACAGLDGQHPCVGGGQGAIDGGQAVHVLRCVLQHAVAPVAVLCRVHWHRLESPPTCICIVFFWVVGLLCLVYSRFSVLGLLFFVYIVACVPAGLHNMTPVLS